MNRIDVITMTNLLRQSVAGLRAMLVLTVLLGVLYPGAVWGVGQLVARDQAAGSLVTVDGTVVGSRLLGQQWEGEPVVPVAPVSERPRRRHERGQQPRPGRRSRRGGRRRAAGGRGSTRPPLPPTR